MKEIITKITPDLEITIETRGFQGSACKKATEGLKQALGTTVNEQDTEEMNQSARTNTQNKLRG